MGDCHQACVHGTGARGVPLAGRTDLRARDASARLHTIIGGAARSLLLDSGNLSLLAQKLRAHALDEATNALRRQEPEYSAAEVITSEQIRMFWLISAVSIAAIIFFPRVGLLILTAAVAAGYLANAVFRGWLFWVGADEKPAARDERTTTNFPIYTVLVPMYREANVLPQLAASLRQMRYPGIR